MKLSDINQPRAIRNIKLDILNDGVTYVVLGVDILSYKAICQVT